MQTITPFLWFNGKARQAMDFYLSVFKNAKVIDVTPAQGDEVMSVVFEIEGNRFIGFNGGPMFSFTPAISFMVQCDTQAEVDYLWEHLAANGGQYQRCGWLTDQFGLSWQIIPKGMGQLLQHPDAAKAKKALQAMMQMTKIDLAAMQLACNEA